jgi:hypothetical protein
MNPGSVYERLAPARIVAAALLLSGSAMAMAALESEEQRALQGMDVIGNRELPKALYIVPWQSAELGESVPSPSSGLFNEGLGPLDPEVFRRELDYHQAMQAAE